MQRQRGELVPIGEVISGLDDVAGAGDPRRLAPGAAPGVSTVTVQNRTLRTPLQFAPRIRDLGAQHLYRLDAPPRKEGAGILLKGLVRRTRETSCPGPCEILAAWSRLSSSCSGSRARTTVVGSTASGTKERPSTPSGASLFFAHEGKVQRRQADQQTNQVLCLNLVTNAIVTWNTLYMNAAIEQLRAEGSIGPDVGLGHLSPALYGHINP